MNAQPQRSIHGAPGAARPTAVDRLEVGGRAIELLRVPATLYGAALALRSFAYGLGLARPTRIAAPVVSVGNLTTGGTGKTPFVLLVARELERRGLAPAVVARGYGAQVGELNDEGAELAARWPGLIQEQDQDRVAAARRAVQRGAQVVVLDDGFQHRRLARDLDLVLVDATNPWGLRATRALLPRGLLREPLGALARADLLVLTRVDQVAPAELESLRAELLRIAPGAGQLAAVHAAESLVDARGADLGLAWLAGRAVCAASALGNPRAFESALERLGARVVRVVRRPDHHAWAAGDRADLAGDAPVVCSGKDAAKLARLGVDAKVLLVSARLVEGAGVLEARLDALCPTPARRVERSRRVKS
jgi:tetraacyldisaccharide 4'-kinase